MILLGKPVAEKIYQKIEKDIKLFLSFRNRKINSKINRKIRPEIASIIVGEDAASLVYIKIKEKQAQKLGINFKVYHLSEMAAQSKLEELILDLNQNKYVFGIIVQLPLPKNFDQEKILKTIASAKDIDGFQGKMPAPTAAAILEILKFYKISLKNKNIVIVGHGRLVGKPLAAMLKKQGLKPIICDSNTQNLTEKILKAEVIVSAAGSPGLIKPAMVSKAAVVIDAGTAEAKGKMAGDVEPTVYQKVSAYAPSPGGVGPVTVACLMRNVVLAVKKQEKK